MGRPSTPTGRAKRIRIRLFCHMGIEMDKRFWESYSIRRREVRQDHLRRCLLVGFLSGRLLESGPPESDAQILSIQIEILADDPDYVLILDKYHSLWTGDDRTSWVRKTVLSGHEIISGNVAFPLESGTEKQQESRLEKSLSDPKKLIGELFK